MIYGQAQADSISNKAMTTGFGNHKNVRIALRPKDSATSADMEAVDQRLREDDGFHGVALHSLTDL